MRMISKLLIANAGAIVFAGGALAAGDNVRVLRVVMPDGSVQHVRYVGNAAPRIIVVPVERVAMPISPIDVHFVQQIQMLDRMVADMDRRMDIMHRQAAALQAHARAQMPAGKEQVRVASTGAMPAGTVRYSFVSSSNGGRSCSHSVQISSAGANQPAKVVEQSFGDCQTAGKQPVAGSQRRVRPAEVRSDVPKKPAPQMIKVRDTV